MIKKNYKKNINSTKELIDSLKSNHKILKKKQLNFLRQNGYLIIRKNKYLLENLKYFRGEIDKFVKKDGKKGGWEGKKKFYRKGKLFEPGAKRLGNLIEKNIIFSDLIIIPEILLCAKDVIKDEIKVCGLNFREPKKGTGYQKIHMDWKPRKKKSGKFAGIVAMIFFDNADNKNGATRLIPKTHLKKDWPEKYIDINVKNKKEICPKINAGDILIANLNLWHAGSDNLNGKRRRMIMLNIKRRNLPQLLNYQKFLSSSTKSKLSNSQKYLLALRNNDKIQKSDSIGVGKYYKKDFQLNNILQRRV